MHKKLLVGTILALALSLGVITVARAILKDTEYSTGNTVKGATLNLQVGDTDPSTLSFSFDEMVPGIQQQIFTDIISDGGYDGNFWLEVSTSNSQEMENPESETDVTGDGELEECASLKIVFDVGSTDPITLLDYTTVSEVPAELDRLKGTVLDERIAAGSEMNLMMITNACGSEAQGDAFDLDLTFHLDQI
jgi:hypothetical protein